MKKVAIYIPCHNAEKFIAGCLESVLGQSLKPEEIIVVNDGSTDRTVEVAGEFPVRIIHLQDHPGLAAARNAAIAATDHDYIASIDADCLPEPTWLESLMKCLAEEGANGAGGKLIEAHQVRLADRWRAVHMRQNWGEGKIVNPPFLFGCNTLFEKSALEDVGGYDTRFRTNGEDVDISNRLREKGYTLIYESSALLKHLKQDTVPSVLQADWNWGYITSGDTLKFNSNSNIVYANFTNSKYRFLKDVTARRNSLLPIDILLFVLHTYWDIRHARRLGLHTRSGLGPASRMRTLSDFHVHLDMLSKRKFLQKPDSMPAERPRRRNHSAPEK